ncbi:hypothetical protein CAPTEDRAFT_201071 [Capitella teleta]|nr:hypothetical protein CAPTEDRAFT_201071 [Capitella teleta]|eukprot:ELU14174.1 hypothetical protein CAPTEDRAFT_201071 [Capitella teleta]
MFCDAFGKELLSNELARISRVGVGGSVTDMRKAQYLAAQQKNPEGISNDSFEALASHMTHAESTARKYYKVTEPTKLSLQASDMMAMNFNLSTSSDTSPDVESHGDQQDVNTGTSSQSVISPVARPAKMNGVTR